MVSRKGYNLFLNIDPEPLLGTVMCSKELYQAMIAASAQILRTATSNIVLRYMRATLTISNGSALGSQTRWEKELKGLWANCLAGT